MTCWIGRVTAHLLLPLADLRVRHVVILACDREIDPAFELDTVEATLKLLDRIAGLVPI
jgi:hypothetical protein